MVYVDKVRYAKDLQGNESYISEMMWTNALTENAYKRYTKTDMIKFINDNPVVLTRSITDTADGATAKKFTWLITII